MQFVQLLSDKPNVMKIKALILSISLFCAFSLVQAQCENEIIMCEKYFTQEYISDGQTYRALIHNDQIAEFDITLFSGNTYRFASCSGGAEGNLVFRLFDEQKNQLFSNQNFSNAPYWDFVVETTIDVTVEAQLDINKLESGCALLLIGFKK